MHTLHYDVVVIGAGPAGSRTAELVSDGGYRVLLLEKRDRIGFPIRCAEAVGPREDVERFLKLDDELISSPVNGIRIFSPGGEKYEKEMLGIGFVVDRELFDRRLAGIASASGAELRTGHQAMGLLERDGRINGVRVKELKTGTEYGVAAQVVVGADGVEALSPRWAGLKEAFRPGEIFSCAQELVEGIDGVDSYIEFHLGSNIAPGGYAWVFPKGNRAANVGVGINPLKADGRNSLDYLNVFIGQRCPRGERRRLIIGGCSVARGLKRLATDGYLAVGEAARQNNPFSGGGIINALEGADMAAEAILPALRNGNTSFRALNRYSKRWRGGVGRSNETFYHAAQVFYNLSDGEMNKTIRKLTRIPGIFDEKGIKPLKMILSMVTLEPSLFIRYMKSLTGR